MDRFSPAGSLSPALIEQLQATPWKYGFFALVRRINANPAIEPVGTASLPATEPFRIGQKPSLIFAPSEIADARVVNGKLRIRLYSLGMLGPNGPLPLHVTEIAREREELRGDPTLCNFLDIFHHRSLTLLYRAWASAQSAASLDRPDDDRFSFYIGCLSGCSPRHDRTVSLPLHARLSAAPHLVSEARNVDALAMSMTRHFGAPVRIEEYSDHWIVLPAELQCRMGQQGMSASLGRGAILGGHVPDRRHRFCMVIGPLDMADYHRFTPRGDSLLRLVAWVRAYMGLEFEWLLELQIKPHCAPPAVTGDHHQLGWSAWLGESPTGKPVTGMRFKPEQYVAQLVQKAAEQKTGASE
jgi:type VI secretion system protein ImpH